MEYEQDRIIDSGYAIPTLVAEIHGQIAAAYHDHRDTGGVTIHWTIQPRNIQPDSHGGTW